jgi:xanthine dehydrogenase FAD-binding subunit
MNLWQDYHRPITVQEALTALESSPGPACAIAGGTDLMLDLQQGRHPPVHRLVDLTGVAEMNCLDVRSGRLFIGAAVPLSRVYAAPLVQEHAQALVEACRLVGGPQVRNVATLGGNVAHALPAADGTIALMCLDVQGEIASQSGTRLVTFPDLFLGPGRSALKPGAELVVGFHVPLRQPGQASAFRRVMRAQGIALPILNLSAWVERSGNVIKAVRLVAGPAGPTPRRMTQAENCLIGYPLDAEVLQTALDALLGEAQFRTSPRRATEDYRRHLVGVLLKETLEVAWQRCGLTQD